MECQWVLTQHRFMLIFFFITLNQSTPLHLSQLVLESSFQFPYSIGRFIDGLCVVNDRNYFFENFKKINPKEIDLTL